MKAFEVVKILKKNGWHEVHCVGSHHKFKHESGKVVTFAYHDIQKEVRPDVLRSLEKQTGLKFKR